MADIKISLREASPIKVKTANRLVINADHSIMENLDYEHSGHTGFTPSRLSLLDHIENFNEDSSKVFINDENGNAGYVYANQLKGSQIKTVQQIPANTKVGEYYFKEVN